MIRIIKGGFRIVPGEILNSRRGRVVAPLAPATTQIKTGQEKVRSKGEERTEIVIERIESAAA